MECGDLISFDDVPTAVLIDFSPPPSPAEVCGSRSTLGVESASLPFAPKECPPHVIITEERAISAKLPERAAVRDGLPLANPTRSEITEAEGVIPSRNDSVACRVPSLSNLLEADENDGFLNVTPPDLTATPPDSPVIHQNEGVVPVPEAKKLDVFVSDFEKIAEETQNIVSWMREESDFCLGDHVTYKTSNYSATRKTRKSALPQLDDVVKRYRRISSALSTPSNTDESGTGAKSATPMVAVVPAVKPELPKLKSSLKGVKITEHSDPSGLRGVRGLKSRNPVLPKKSVAFEDSHRLLHHHHDSPEGVRKVALPRMLRLANPVPNHAHHAQAHSLHVHHKDNHHAHAGPGHHHNQQGGNKENGAKPVAKVGPLRAVKPVTCMVKPTVVEAPASEAEAKKPLAPVGQVPPATGGAKRVIIGAASKGRSGSLDRVTAGVKSMTLTSPSANRLPRAAVTSRLRSTSSNRIVTRSVASVAANNK